MGAQGIAFLALLAGCAADTSRFDEPFDRSKGLSLEPVPPHEAEEDAQAKKRAVESVAKGLTLAEAERIALEVNSNILAAAEAVNAARANVWQQSLFSNPGFQFGKGEIPTSTTKVDGSGSLVPNLTSDTFPNARPIKAWDLRASTTYFQFSKDFDVSGKRVARTGSAIETERQTEAQYASTARQLKAQVRTAFAAILVAERGLELAHEARDMARQSFEILGTGAIGGKVLEGDSAQAESADDRAGIDLEQAELNLKNAKLNFLSLLECPELTLGPLGGTLPLEKLPPGLEAASLVKDALEHNADVIAARRNVLAAEASLRLQNRSVIPDVTLQATYNRYILDKFDSVAFGVGVPLPVFDQNRAQIAQATANLHQAEAQESATEVNIEQAVRADLHQVATSWKRIETFEHEILPKARKSWKLTEESYLAGKVLYLSVIAARQNFNQQQQDYATELLAYETAMADLERLLGRPLEGKTP